MGKGGRREVADSVKNVYAQRSSGIILPEYRLPTEAEWEYAALALVGNREYNIYKGQKKYPWKGQYTRSGKRQYRGDQLANFKQGKGDYGGIAGWSDDGADITNKVKSYAPNDFGLYDMAGNVCEWTQRSSMNGGRIASGGSNNTDETQNYSLCNRKVYEITSPWKEVGTRMTMYVN